MRDLSTFIKDTYNKCSIDKLFEGCMHIDSIESAERLAKHIGNGHYVNATFESTLYKNRFIQVLSNLKPNINVVNCNSSVDRFFENDFNGFLVFNNLKFCQHKEIIEEIKHHKGVMIL